MNVPTTIEGVLAEFLGIMAQEIPELGSPSSKEAAYARGRNAEKAAAANYLSFHIKRLGLALPAADALPDTAPWPPVRRATVSSYPAPPTRTAETYDECRDTAFLGHLYDKHLPTPPPPPGDSGQPGTATGATEA